MTSFERLQCNPRLIANDLGDSGFVLYVPPNPRPLRISSNLWQIINSAQQSELTLDEWKCLLVNHEGLDINPRHDLDWLIRERVLLRVTQSTPEKFHDNGADIHSTDEVLEIGDISESNGLLLFTLNPSWSPLLRRVLRQILQLHLILSLPMGLIVLAYLLFFVLTPAPTALSLLFADGVQSSASDFFTKTLIALLSVNLISTSLTWLSQSLTGIGDGKILLRFLFGFIPRLGINPYKGSALHSRVWNQEAKDALLCIAQPLLTRLSFASVLILLFASGRLHSGLSGGFLYGVCMVVLQISLISGLVLALPFRMSPGYRLMILLTNLPLNTIGRSARHFVDIIYAFCCYLRLPNRSTLSDLTSLFASKRDVGLFFFAIAFFGVVFGKLILILLLVIPRFAADTPNFMGGATQLLLTLLLLALFGRFVGLSIFPKLFKLITRHGTRALSRPVADQQLASDMPDITTKFLTKKQIQFIAVGVAGCFLLVPIDRTVTGSVLVSSQRDLMVRAPEDVVVTAIYQDGPSSDVVEIGTKIVQLESSQLERDLHQSELDNVEMQNDLDVLFEQQKANQSLLIELKNSLVKYHQAGRILFKQQKELERLSKMGGASRQSVYELEINYFEIKEEERLKRQQILELKADLESYDLKVKALQQSIGQAEAWRDLLLQQKEQLSIVMPFNGLITSSTSGLMGSFVAKGESLLELKQGSLDRVTVLIPDHDRSRLRVGQKAIVRLYANPNKSLPGFVQTIRPAGELVDQKVFFEATLGLEKSLSPQLLQSSGAARINAGQTNLLSIFLASLARFFRVDVWSWTP